MLIIQYVHCHSTQRTCAAVTQRLLAGTGQRGDGQRRRAGHQLEMLADGWDGGGLGVNAVGTGEILAARRKRTLPVRELDGHLTAEVKPC